MGRKPKFFDENGVAWRDRFPKTNEGRLKYNLFMGRIYNWGITPEQSFEVRDLNATDARKVLGIYREPLSKVSTKNGLSKTGMWYRVVIKEMTVEEAATKPKEISRPIKHRINGVPVKDLVDEKQYNRFIYRIGQGMTVKKAYEESFNGKK